MALPQQFAQDFSVSAFRRVHGDMHIVGKWGPIVRLEDGTYDPWFVHPDLSPLSGQKLAAIQRQCPDSITLDLLDGEAFTQGATREFVLEVAQLAGLPKKRRATTSKSRDSSCVVRPVSRHMGLRSRLEPARPCDLPRYNS